MIFLHPDAETRGLLPSQFHDMTCGLEALPIHQHSRDWSLHITDLLFLPSTNVNIRLVFLRNSPIRSFDTVFGDQEFHSRITQSASRTRHYIHIAYDIPPEHGEHHPQTQQLLALKLQILTLH